MGVAWPAWQAGEPAGGPARSAASTPGTTPQPDPSVETIPPPAAAPPDLPEIGYWSPPPSGFPPDPEPGSTAPITEGAQPQQPLALYDGPGGRPLAFLPPAISGLPVTVPIVQRRSGWAAVLLTSTNRSVGWLPPHGWTAVPLRDQLVLRRQRHELAWYRDGAWKAAWTVSVGTPRTPTPLGRSFVLGRTTLSGRVYAGVDVLVLGSVPDDPASVGASLRGAHTGIHAWYRNEFGRNSSNGCIRMPKAAQQVLLAEIGPGTSVVVLD
jgi:hypothetical protein